MNSLRISVTVFWMLRRRMASDRRTSPITTVGGQCFFLRTIETRQQLLTFGGGGQRALTSVTRLQEGTDEQEHAEGRHRAALDAPDPPSNVLYNIL